MKIKSILVIATLAAMVLPATSIARFPQIPTGSPKGSGFLGTWCAQGIPTKQTSISSNGVFFNLVNEDGQTSIGHLQGVRQDVLVADGWQFVEGTLGSNGDRINWSNGTFWARCSGGGNRRPNIDGTWYRGGDHSLACYIRQKGKNLQLTNEAGATGKGTINNNGYISTKWSGASIAGSLSSSGDRITWNNGTYWTR